MTYENRVAYHAGVVIIKGYPEFGLALNHYSIGIELLAIRTREEMISLSEIQESKKTDYNSLVMMNIRTEKRILGAYLTGKK